MKIIIITTSVGSFGKKGYYNLQEVGFAKALDKHFDQVDIYKAVDINDNKTEEKIENTQNAFLHLIPCKHRGNNGYMDLSIIPTDTDIVINCSDTQFFTPSVYKWAKKNHILYLPYIGVIESHSNNPVLKLITNMMFVRNLNIYKKATCLVKTPYVESELKKRGVKNLIVTPVGLDISLLKNDFEEYDRETLKRKYGFQNNEKILLFIGRLSAEKQPLEMIDIYNEVLKKDPDYRLLMVGNGELKEELQKKIQENNLNDNVKLIEKIPNRDIWELYRIGDCFVNLNKQEIFGMAIMEAMYYGCKVVAWNAPGPDFIIQSGVSSYLTADKEELIDAILRETDMSKAAQKRIVENFTWDATVMRLRSAGLFKTNK